MQTAAEKAKAAAHSFGSAALALNYFQQVASRSSYDAGDAEYAHQLRVLARAEQARAAANDDAAGVQAEAA